MLSPKRLSVKYIAGNGRYFEVGIYRIDSDTKLPLLYEAIFKIFGDNIGAMNINLNNTEITHNHWIITCIHKYCQSITHIKLARVECDLTIFLSCMPKLTNLHLSQAWENWEPFEKPFATTMATFKCPVLQSFKETDVNWTKEDKFKYFNNNSQLETLSLELDFQTFFHLLHLPRLKKLHLIKKDRRFSRIPIFKMPVLETLVISYANSDILMAMASCTCVTKIKFNRVIWSDSLVEALSAFKQLKSLEIKSTQLEHLNKVVEHLPNLPRLSVSDVVDFVKMDQALFHTWMTATKFSHLTIRVPYLPVSSHSFI